MGHANPSHRAEAACGLGMLLLRVGRIDDAEVPLNSAAESTDPRWAGWGTLKIAQISELKGDIQSARVVYERLSTNDDKEVRAEALSRLGLILFRLKDPAAEATLRRASDLVETFGGRQAGVNLAVMLEQSKRTGEAVDIYQRVAASRDPELSPKALVNLGLLLNRLGERGRARECFTQALATRHPRHACNAAVNLCEMDRDDGRLVSALHFLEAAMEFDQVDLAAELHLRRADLLVALGRLSAARQEFHRVIETGHRDYAPAAYERLQKLPKV